MIGCVEFSEHALIKLIELESKKVCEVVGVITKKNSKFNADFVDLRSSLIKGGRAETRIHYYLGDVRLLEFLGQIKPDVIYCFGWSSLLSQEVLRSASKGVIGFHPAALPKNRGRHPIIWALTLGLTETASTFFRMDEGADSGPILSQKTLAITPCDDARSLYDKIVQVAVKQIEDFTVKLADKSENFQDQDHSLANYWRKRSAKDGLIDWRMAADNIHNLVRALADPYPGADLHVEGSGLIKVWKSSVSDGSVLSNIEPGKVLQVENNMTLVKCAGSTALWLEHTEPALNVSEGQYL